MVFSLNFVWRKDSQYIHASHELYSSIGGPAFSILKATIALIIIEKRKSLIAYPFVFFPMFGRFFADLLGGVEKQDEARISTLTGTETHPVAGIVLAILLLIVIRCSYKLKLDARTNGYALTASTISQLPVIGTYTFIRI
jgi:hypothetical protein